MEASEFCRCSATDTPHVHPRYADSSYWEAAPADKTPTSEDPHVDPVPVVPTGVEGETGAVTEPVPPADNPTPSVPATPEA